MLCVEKHREVEEIDKMANATDAGEKESVCAIYQSVKYVHLFAFVGCP